MGRGKVIRVASGTRASLFPALHPPSWAALTEVVAKCFAVHLPGTYIV